MTTRFRFNLEIVADKAATADGFDPLAALVGQGGDVDGRDALGRLLGAIDEWSATDVRISVSLLEISP